MDPSLGRLPQLNQNIHPDQPQGFTLQSFLSIVKNETIKASRIGIEIFQYSFKLIGSTQMGTFLSQCRSGVLWVEVGTGQLPQNLDKTLQKPIDSPHDFVEFLKTFRNLCQLISIPIDLGLKNEVFSEGMDSALRLCHQNFTNGLLDIQLVESNFKAGESKFPDPSLISNPHLKCKLIAEKVSQLIPISKKLQAPQLFACLSLITALSNAYIIYSEKTNLPAKELMKILKIQAEVTIKLQEKVFNKVLENELLEGMTENEKIEIKQEIQDVMKTHLHLILTSKNDWIHEELMEYKKHINQLYFFYGIEGSPHIDEAIDNLLKSSQILVDHREKIEKQSQGVLDNFHKFCNEQQNFIKVTFTNFHNIFKEENFEKFIKPEFEGLIAQFQVQEMELKNDLKMLQNNRFEITPFSLLSLEEQISWCIDIQKKYAEKQNELAKAVKDFSRQQ